MKLILLSDLHFDVSNGNENILKQQIMFFEKLLFPYMLENNIKVIFQFGDFTDNRKHISLNVQHELKEKVFDKLIEYNITMYTLLGNHDLYLKNSRDIYSMEIFEKAYASHFTVVKDPMLIQFDSLYVQVLPWVIEESDVIINNKADVIFSHMEAKDYYVSKTYQSTHGIDDKIFGDIPVYSGHYHLKQMDGKIKYLGTPYESTWTDFLESKGFYVMDSETKEVEFIENMITTKHVKCHIDIDTKTVLVEGLGETQEIKINKKINYNMFKNYKLKIYCNRELAIVKQFVEGIDGLCASYKLEILPDIEDDINIEDRIDKAKDYSIEDTIVDVNDEDDKNLVHELISEAKQMMKD